MASEPEWEREKIKLSAAFLNGTALLTIGVTGLSAGLQLSFKHDLGLWGWDGEVLVVVLFSVAVGIMLHLIARLVLDGLDRSKGDTFGKAPDGWKLILQWGWKLLFRR